MATQKSVNVTNLETQPVTVFNASILGGYLFNFTDTIEATALTTNDIVIMSPLPVNAILNSIQLATDDLGTTGALSLGLYKKNTDGTYTAVLSNAFATSLDVNTTAVAFTERRYSNLDINTVSQKLWQLAGLSASPDYDSLYIACLATTGTTATGTISIKGSYSV